MTTPGPLAEVLIDKASLEARIDELAGELDGSFDGSSDPLFVSVLKGATLFMADLVRAMETTVAVEFLSISAYAGGRGGVVRIVKDLDESVEGRDVVIVEDIVDTGLTLNYLQEILRKRAPRSLKTACLLSKPSRRQVDVPVEYIGFTIEDEFVVGYGLDYAEKYRNLPYIAVLQE